MSDKLSVAAAHAAQVERMRVVMGTAPSAHPPYQTEFWRGVEGIEVQLVPGSYPRNPYRSIYELATMTWGSTNDPATKWERTPPRARADVVKAVLSFKSLPNAMEAPSFTFVVNRVSRWAFDQIARARIGVIFSSMGTRDNCHLDIGFRLHEATWRSDVRREAVMRACLSAKESYREIVETGAGSWQEARTVLPISCLHRFGMGINFLALRNLCNKRMQACEAEDVVAVAWLMRAQLERRYPYLAAWLRPGCDGARRCTYHESYSMSEAFGALFRGCGRWPSPDYTLGEDFQRNESCSDYATISRQIGYEIPDGLLRRPEGLDPFENELDRELFCEDWDGEAAL